MEIKKIIGAAKYFLKALINTLSTPKGYRFDYFLSMIYPDLLFNRPIPWMNYGAVAYIESVIKQNAKVFEYGSGASTLYWMTRCLEVVSIEHDKNFHNEISVRFNKSVCSFLIEPENDNAKFHYDLSSPDAFQSSDFKGHSFEKYVKSIDAFQDGYFDLVVVDGRARPSCIKRSISKIRSGGMLVVDNSDREYYWVKTSDLLRGWSKKVYRGTVRGLLHYEQTSIFVKP
jgi:hypothetical protein